MAIEPLANDQEGNRGSAIFRSIEPPNQQIQDIV